MPPQLQGSGYLLFQEWTDRDINPTFVTRGIQDILIAWCEKNYYKAHALFLQLAGKTKQVGLDLCAAWRTFVQHATNPACEVEDRLPEPMLYFICPFFQNSLHACRDAQVQDLTFGVVWVNSWASAIQATHREHGTVLFFNGQMYKEAPLRFEAVLNV
jgi:hypothetical protein